MVLTCNEQGFNEIIVTTDCEWNEFYSYAEKLEMALNIQYQNQLQDLDSCYWDFRFNDSDITIHYHAMVGISIFPQKCADFEEKDNQVIVKIFEILENDKLNRFYFQHPTQ